MYIKWMENQKAILNKWKEIYPTEGVITELEYYSYATIPYNCSFAPRYFFSMPKNSICLIGRSGQFGLPYDLIFIEVFGKVTSKGTNYANKVAEKEILSLPINKEKYNFDEDFWEWHYSSKVVYMGNNSSYETNLEVLSKSLLRFCNNSIISFEPICSDSDISGNKPKKLVIKTRSEDNLF